MIILPGMRITPARSRNRPRRAVLAGVALLLGACASLSQQDARESLANAERAFARDGIALGVRDAFIAHFAPDGLVFEPAPVRVRETWPTRPAPADPRALRLEWHPELVEVARAGDLGLSTGPYRIVDATGRRPGDEGAFFSVWQRQSDGTWKVWLDMGARSTGPIDAAVWRAPPRPRPGPQDAATPTATTITALDRALSGLPGPTFAQHLALDARRYRSSAAPLVGEAWSALLARGDSTADYAPSEARVSASGDFAASYGRITQRRSDGASFPGYYVHVWVRDAGAWWLAVETVVDEG